MNDEINELYQQVILDHYKNPRNYGTLEPHNHEAEGFNPLCGDHYNIRLEVEDGIIKKIMFDGTGCAISKASASVMTTLLEGKTLEEARKIFEDFHYVITSDVNTEIDFDRYGKIAVFAGVREFPSRIKCANLAWHTMLEAIDEKSNKNNPVTTDKN